MNITASFNKSQFQKNLIRVKSSNMWGYAADVKNPKSKVCDVYIQFKGKDGGPDDVYIYYDVPLIVYRRMHTAPSKGHYFYQYIRNNYLYRKLTGDKKTKLKNGIN